MCDSLEVELIDVVVIKWGHQIGSVAEFPL